MVPEVQLPMLTAMLTFSVDGRCPVTREHIRWARRGQS